MYGILVEKQQREDERLTSGTDREQRPSAREADRDRLLERLTETVC